MENAEILQHLQAIQDREGRLTAKAVVDTARHPDHPLHGEFTWDDAVAGEKYREQQARTLIRRVKVEFQVEDRIVTAVAYIRDPEAPQKLQGYRSISRIAGDTEVARAAVISEFSHAAAHLRRARDIANALGLAEQIEALLRGMAEIHHLIQPVAAEPETTAPVI